MRHERCNHILSTVYSLLYTAYRYMSHVSCLIVAHFPDCPHDYRAIHRIVAHLNWNYENYENETETE